MPTLLILSIGLTGCDEVVDADPDDPTDDSTEDISSLLQETPFSAEVTDFQIQERDVGQTFESFSAGEGTVPIMTPGKEGIVVEATMATSPADLLAGGADGDALREGSINDPRSRGGCPSVRSALPTRLLRGEQPRNAAALRRIDRP